MKRKAVQFPKDPDYTVTLCPLVDFRDRKLWFEREKKRTWFETVEIPEGAEITSATLEGKS